MIFTQIAAMARNRVIGVNNDLPWNIPEDMKFFRDTTKGHIMIMGRKTFESFPKVLKNRYHIVITRNTDYQVDDPNVHVVSNPEDAKAKALEMQDTWGDEAFIVGGGEIYRQALPMTDQIHLTIIDKEFDGDTLFPELPEKDWENTKSDHREGPIPFSFNLFKRKPSS